MKFITYEVRKLINLRYLWIFVAILLVANAALCIYVTQEIVQNKTPQDIVNDFFELYSMEPERIENEYLALLALRDERDRLWLEAMRQDDLSFQSEPLPRKYIQSDIFDDLSLLYEVFNRKNYISSYPSEIEKVMNRTTGFFVGTVVW